MNGFLNGLYWVLIIVGVIDLVLVTPALTTAHDAQTRGRLFATLAVLSGLVVAAGGRTSHVLILVVVGVASVVVGLIGYALYLPYERGLLALYRRNRKDRGSAP